MIDTVLRVRGVSIAVGNLVVPGRLPAAGYIPVPSSGLAVAEPELQRLARRREIGTAEPCAVSANAKGRLILLMAIE